jgi:DNA-binding HxlR family transcriptional regulator
VFRALRSAPLTERALLARVRSVSPSVAAQRLADLRRIRAVETVPESGELRLSAAGRRLQGHLDSLAGWTLTGR